MAERNPKKDKTTTLLRELLSTPDLNDFISDNADILQQLPFHAYITQICTAAGQVPEQAIKRAGIERTYGHQLFNGTRNPSRDKVLQLAFGLGLDFDGAQKLLRVAGMSSLYPKIERDAAIIHCLHHNKDVYETQAVLQGLGLTLLGEG